ncbi:MAG: hypothetical protein H7Y11_07240 [Armatimonadetes bacterium]|nr:hypothetical protein [Anaerolineae bacterium]
MSRLRMLCIVLSFSFSALLIGCAPASPATEQGALPTLFEPPTNTPTVEVTASTTPTPSATLTPSRTASVTRTATASSTVQPGTATVSPTASRTVTSTPARTQPPRATVTNSLTPSNTPGGATETPVASTLDASLTLTGTSELARIDLFQSSATNAAPGEAVTLFWQGVGDVARIERLDALAQVAETFSVTPTGQLPVTIPAGAGSAIIYRLTIARGSQTVTATLTITVDGTALTCPTNWFFGNTLAPPDAGCPTAAQVIVAGAYQPFQTGRMLFLQNNVFVLVDSADGLAGTMINYVNGWDGTSTYASYGSVYNGCATPVPSGLFDPQQMFAWAYCVQLGPLGTWDISLGYATAPIDTTQRTVQSDASGALYTDIPGGGVYRLIPVPPGQLSTQWLKIK